LAGTRKKCKVCDHPKLDQINARIRNNDTISSIAKLYGISRDTITKHKKACIGALIVADKNIKELLAGEVMIKQIQLDMKMMHKMLMACDRWMTDPENPEEYFIGERGTEIEVVYHTMDENGEPSKQRKKDTLQTLLNIIDSDGQYLRVDVNSKAADPRELLVKAATKLENTAEMIMKATQKQLENEYKNKAMTKVGEEGGIITFEEELKQLTKRVIIASRGNENQKLAELAELPDLK